MTVMLGTVNVVLEPFRKVRRKHCIIFCVIVRLRSRNACCQARHQFKGSGNVGLSKIALLSTRGQSQSHDTSYLTMHASPHLQAAKRPGTAVALAFGAVGLFLFMTVTVKLMLGIGDDGDFEYLTRGI